MERRRGDEKLKEEGERGRGVEKGEISGTRGQYIKQGVAKATNNLFIFFCFTSLSLQVPDSHSEQQAGSRVFWSRLHSCSQEPVAQLYSSCRGIMTISGCKPPSRLALTIPRYGGGEGDGSGGGREEKI